MCQAPPVGKHDNEAQEEDQSESTKESQIEAEWKYIVTFMDRMFFLTYIIVIVSIQMFYFPVPLVNRFSDIKEFTPESGVIASLLASQQAPTLVSNTMLNYFMIILKQETK